LFLGFFLLVTKGELKCKLTRKYNKKIFKNAMTNYNLEVIQGSTFSTILSLTNSDGSIISLANYVPTGQIRYSYGSSTVLLSLKPTIYSITGGQISLIISGSESSNLPCGQFPYDIEIFTTGLSDETILKPILGYCSIFPEITR
jgi:hypothetical protein